MKVVKKLCGLLLTDQNGQLYGNEIYITSIPYLSSINMNLCGVMAIEDTHHCCPWARQ